ncbi:MAG: hypothetical protein HQK79_01495 [Desulfobacterales bacterium]|nr:hypothetical protein [Desulfobacterales bacterium]
MRWTLLLVRDDGKLLKITWLRSFIFIFFIVLFPVSFISAIYFYNFITDENKRLSSDINTLNQEIKILKNEKDILMAKVVLTESKGSHSKKYTKDPFSTSLITMSGLLDVNENIDFGFSKEAIPKKEIEIEKKEDKTPNIIIDNFSVSYEKRKKNLKVNFNIKKEETIDKKLAIYCFVMLNAENKTIIIPNVDLIDEKPSKVNTGKRLSLNKDNHVTFKVKAQSGYKDFKSATVFLFDKEENLIFEKKMVVH